VEFCQSAFQLGAHFAGEDDKNYYTTNVTTSAEKKAAFTSTPSHLPPPTIVRAAAFDLNTNLAALGQELFICH